MSEINSSNGSLDRQPPSDSVAEDSNASSETGCHSCGLIGHKKRSSKHCLNRILRSPKRRLLNEQASFPIIIESLTPTLNENTVESNTTTLSENIIETHVDDVDVELDINVIDQDNNINENENVEVPTTTETLCSSCEQPGHSRNTHFSCPHNPAFDSVPEIVARRVVRRTVRSGTVHNSARNPGIPEVERHMLGGMDEVCVKCNAYMWMAERKSTSSMINARFQVCCADGKALIKPFTPLPEAIANLLRNNDNESKEFKQNIRSYNSALSFTSMNADLDRNYANSRGGAYAFRIHGAVHHLMSSSLLPNEGDNVRPKFAQIYIFDSENELANRMNVAGNSGVSEVTMGSLQQMMHNVNPFVNLFKSMEEIASEQPGGIRDIRMIFRAEGVPDPRRYNSPTAPEIGVLIVGGEDDPSDSEPKNRDIVLRLKGPGNDLSQINEIHQHYDPLQYVLMFPFGDSGWDCKLRSYDPENVDGAEEITIMQYYSARLMIRPCTSNNNLPKNQQVGIHSFGKLFHQYVVDMYAKMEQQRLNFVRFNQKSLRAEVYNGLRDAIRLDDNDMGSIGKRVILPSTFIGGPRFMQQLFQDAMNIVRRFGKPDLFITFTCNPAWPEIANELLHNQTASERPDLCARVFNLKLRALMDDIVKRHVLGKVVAYVYSIEFQKRGLPHCHMLIILDAADKPKTEEDIDKIVSAEIPNPATHPLAHKTVTTSMVHGPCGLLNPEALCMKNGKCTKKYPFNFTPTTTIDDNDQGSKITYRRRVMIDRTVMRNNGTTTVDNRWIVPHNLFLAAKYDAHINVEICSMINSIKYVYKYVYKGHDRAQVHMGDPNEERNDEIKNFLDARYVSAAESCWRLFSFPMHREFPSSQRLDIHLENERKVYFDENDTPQDVLSRSLPESTLTAWFNYNRNNPDDIAAKSICYPDFCENYTFHKQLKPRAWKLRKNGFGGTIGRIYTVSPRDMEKFHLRILLYKIPGATCFADLRTYNGATYTSYQATARAMGLLSDDNEWSATLSEAALNQSPKSLRQLFCILIAFSEVSDLYQLWLDHKESLAEDYLYRSRQEAIRRNEREPTVITDEMFGHCLLDMNDILADHRYDLKTMDGFKDVFPVDDTRTNGQSEQSNSYERMHATLYAESLESVDPDTFNFNENQKVVYETIRDRALNENNTTPNVYFIDGPGGTGKTFLFNALLDRVRRSGNIAIAVASSGTAALLLKGGRTAHSTFRIPLNVSNSSLCEITPRSSIGKFIIESKLIVWDESSMVSKDLVETVDRTFRDVCKSNVPFGGRLVVFGGDFRQVLPIIHKASRAQIVSQCLNKTVFWPQVVRLKLNINMRVQQALASNDDNLALELQQFADYLLKVGEGKIPTVTLPGSIPSDFISIPNAMHLKGSNLLDLLKALYPDIANASTDINYFIDKAVLTTQNKDVTVINNLLLDCIPARPVNYYSHDQISDPLHRMNVPVEFINEVESGSLPPHLLILKVGSPIMVIRNIDPAGGLCNGTRLIVKSLGTNIIEATIATGPNVGEITYIPKIKFNYDAADGKSPYDFYRVQFPVRLAFGMTINKAQGQTLSAVALYLPKHVFGHGQLYVAMSRVRTPKSIKIMVNPEISEIPNEEGHYTHNIVFKEVF